MAPRKNWLEWLWPQERRGSTRKETVPLEAYYWDGDVPEPHYVRDISPDGMFLITEQRWYPNTLVTISLTRRDRPKEDPTRSLRITARVVRSGSDGVGFKFMFVAAQDRRTIDDDPLSNTIDKSIMLEFLDAAQKDSISANIFPLLRALSGA
jgi:hypothetical protein